MQTFYLNIPNLIIFLPVSLYYLYLAISSILKKNLLNSRLIKLNMDLENNLSTFSSLETKNGEAISQEIILEEVNSIGFVKKIRNKLELFLARYPWLLIIIPLVIFFILAFGDNIQNFTYFLTDLLGANWVLIIISLFFLLIFIFVGNSLEVPEMLRFATRISKRENILPADKKYLENTILFFKLGLNI
ncbi:MAG: hypothetical protein HeimC3_35700 [Candidatus Heimdallarchaeota archaeon LC_3]|nr:MAG: hypothetical protein HeimC3_35700 [Candidatus Heimdallarchaeota archaeon LC_3]